MTIEELAKQKGLPPPGSSPLRNISSNPSAPSKKGITLEEFAKQKGLPPPPKRTPTNPAVFQNAGVGFFGRVGDFLKKTGAEVGGKLSDTLSKTASGDINPAETGVRTVGALAGGIGDLAAGAALGVGKALLPKSAEEGIAKSFGSAIQNSDIPKITSSYEEWKKKHPRAATNLESVVDIASLLPVGEGTKFGSTTVAKVAKEGAEGAAVSVARKLDDQALKEALNVTAPTLNVAEKTAAIKRGQLKTTPLGTSRIVSSPRDMEVANAVKGIVKKNAKPEKNIAAVKDSIKQDAGKVKEYLTMNDSIFNDTQLRSSLESAKEGNQILFGTDKSLESAYDSVVNEYFKQLSTKSNNLSGAWEARKAFDDVVEAKFPKAFGQDVGDNIRYNAIRDVRSAVNDYIAGRLPDGSVYKDSLKSMRLKYDAVDNIANSTVRMLDKDLVARAKDVFAKNPVAAPATAILGLANVGGLVTQIMNPVVLGTLLAGGTVYLGKKAVTSKIAKKVIIEALEALQKTPNSVFGAAGGATSAEVINLLKDASSSLEE